MPTSSRPIALLVAPPQGRTPLPTRPALHRTPCKNPCHCEPVIDSLVWQSASPVPLAPLPKGGWHGEAVTGGFLPAPASRKRTPHTPQVSLHQPSVGPPPFRQGRLWRRGADYRDRVVNWPTQCHGILLGAIVAPPPAFVNMFKNCLQGGHLHLKFDALQYGQ